MTTPSERVEYAMSLARPGGTDGFVRVAHQPRSPDADEVLVRHDAIGLNFIDTYHRSGIYQLPSYPAILGEEAAGEVVAAGPQSGFSPGQRVAYVTPTPGAYATSRTLEARFVVGLPDRVDTKIAAAVLLKGLTTRYLLKETTNVTRGTTILVYAAAGGVGSLLVQWARHLGATVIAITGTREKAQRARSYGSQHTIVYSEEDIVKRVRDLTDGKGVDVVYDSVGAPTFETSLACLRKRGLLVSYGQSSGQTPTLETSDLSRAGSVYLTRPTLWHYIDKPGVYRAAAAELLELVAARLLAVEVGASWPLTEVAKAHEALEGRKTHGSVLLVP